MNYGTVALADDRHYRIVGPPGGDQFDVIRVETEIPIARLYVLSDYERMDLRPMRWLAPDLLAELQRQAVHLVRVARGEDRH